MSLIELKAVTKSWGDTNALRSIDLRIEPGSFCVLLGPSGCGKSTTLRIIAGLEEATSGAVWIDGRDVTQLPPAQRGIAMVFQNYALFPHLSVADNIQFGLSVRKLRELQQRLGLTVVYVTHDQTEAMSMADQVVLLHQGQVEQCATPRQMYAAPATTFTARFIGTPAMNLVRLEAGAIAGSAVTTGQTQATSLGIRPEAISLAGEGVPALVMGQEYLGADLVLRCQVGSELLTVRAGGQHRAETGSTVHLHWQPQDMHFFDHGGRRFDPAPVAGVAALAAAA